MRRLLDPRHQGERARHAVYDLVVLLSVLVALQQGDASTHRVAVYLALTLLGVAFAEVYADFVGATLTARRELTRNERLEILGEVLSGLVLSGIPLVWVVLGGLGVLSQAHALDAATWTALLLLGAYAAFGAWAARLPLVRAVAWGVAVGGVGLALVLVKSALH